MDRLEEASASYEAVIALAGTLLIQQDLAQAPHGLELIQRSLALYETLGDPQGAGAATWDNLGNAHLALGKLRLAAEQHQEARRPSDVSQTLLDQIMLSTSPLYLPNVGLEIAWRQIASIEGLGPQSVIGIPLRSQGQSYGAIYPAIDPIPTPSELALLGVLGKLTASALNSQARQENESTC